ncbi:MAG TPA: hypothetical protein VJ995_08500 [Geothermobacteraceae bacterium]|nr:hypothetical protein [Geothermobacteraceae bacterium]
MLKLLLTGLLLTGLVNFACSILILRDLNAAGIKVGFYELRWQIHRHLKAYQRLCREQQGTIGVYYGYLVSLLALIGFVLLLLGWAVEWG